MREHRRRPLTHSSAAEPIECGETSQTVDSWIDYVANQNLQVDDTNDYLLRANWAFIPIARFHAAYGVYDESRSNLLEAVSLLLADDVVSPFVAFGVGAHLDDVDLCALAVSHPSEIVSDSNTHNHNHTHPASSSSDQDAGVGFCFWFNYRNQEKPDPLPHVPHARPGGTLDPRQFALIQWDLLPKNYIWLLIQARQCPSQGVEIGEALTTIWNSMMPNGRAPNFSRTVF